MFWLPAVRLCHGDRRPSGALFSAWSEEGWFEARARLLGALGDGPLDPTNGRAWLMLADRRRLAGDSAGAEAAPARGSHSEDPEIRAEAAGVAGMIELNRQRPQVAARHFREAQRLSPRLAQNYLLEARAHLAAGDRAAAKETVHRGLAALPGDPRLSAMLAELGP